MNYQKGYTIVELMVLLIFCFAVGIGGFLLYVLVHFITKFW